ncbi:cathepsin B-like isoform X2 [Brevipalpus obovatus]|uniref:cathepsin B-like isoform X2 n=1 Tax=Brevipalpus obovatus TaxID=246614 RepID=UPI003D9F9C99
MFLCLVFVGLLFATSHGKPTLPSGIHPLSDEMINRINSLETTWKAGRNFELSQLDHVKSLLGVRRDGNKHRLPVKNIEIRNDIPDTFDARQQWSNCSSIKLIRDQSNCGSCWAFGAVESMSDRICVASGGKTQVNISAEDLVSCCDSCGYGCQGGYPSQAWQYWVDTGIVTGDLYNGGGCRPYSIKPVHHAHEIAPTPPCNQICQPSYSKPYNQDLYYGDSAYLVPSDVKAIQTEIMTHGPVEADFQVYSDFPSYKSGVYIKQSDDLLGGHAIRFIGWGTEKGVDYWLVANSWGYEWGDKGLFKIRRGTDECNIEDDVNAGLPRI